MKIFAILAVVAGLAAGTGQALAARAHHATHIRTLEVVMKDPGCHWFLVQGKTVKKANVRGPIRVKDLDENTLKVASRHGIQYIKVGQARVLHRGHYVVMMVGQAVDDNYLKLTVR